MATIGCLAYSMGRTPGDTVWMKAWGRMNKGAGRLGQWMVEALRPRAELPGRTRGPRGIRGSGLGWHPATHRLAQGGGVSGPWRGAWNTPCRKHHVTMTPQKSRAAEKQRAAQRLPGVGAGTEGTAPTGAMLHPNTSGPPPGEPRVWRDRDACGVSGRKPGPGDLQTRGRGWGGPRGLRERSQSPPFVITLWQITLPEL